MLEVEDVSFSYRHHQILKEISFQFEAGQSICLLGKNGVGKSTLFKCLLGNLKPQQGKILIDKRPISNYSRNDLAKKIAYIPQSQKGIFSFSVFEMVLMGTTSHLRNFQQPGKRERELAESALEMLQIEFLRNKNFSEISGGEQQLVIIARSIAQQSKILIMDEPCANLDFGNQVRVLEMIRRLADKGYLILQSTHDPNQALQYADQVLVIQEGRLAASGEPPIVLTNERLSEIYQTQIQVLKIPSVEQFVCVATHEEEKNNVGNL